MEIKNLFDWVFDVLVRYDSLESYEISVRINRVDVRSCRREFDNDVLHALVALNATMCIFIEDNVIVARLSPNI